MGTLGKENERGRGGRKGICTVNGGRGVREAVFNAGRDGINACVSVCCDVVYGKI